MGHRALLAYRREADDASTAGTNSGNSAGADSSSDPDADSSTDAALDSAGDSTAEEARYDLHRSHWGGANFGLLGRLSPDEPFAADTSFAVDPEPVATDLAIDDIVTNYLDFLHHEAFYLVGTAYETTAYHVLWFGLEADCETVARSVTVGHGALVEAHPDDADYLRGWFRGTKSVVAEMVDCGALAPDESAVVSDESAATVSTESLATVSAESATIACEASATQLLAERTETWAADRGVILPD